MWRQLVHLLAMVQLHVIRSIDVHIGPIRVHRDAHLANVGVVDVVQVSGWEGMKKKREQNMKHR